MTALDMEWVKDNFTPGAILEDTGEVVPDIDAIPRDPILYGALGQPIYHPLVRRMQSYGTPVMVCRRCGQPSWALTAHARERHYDDVVVLPAVRRRPAWLRDAWV